MGTDSKLVMHESKAELHFKDFYTVNIDLICPTLGIPPEVAMSKYDSNFSASRAALKDWEHTLTVNRYDFSSDFYYRVYIFFLHVEILKNKVQAPGYLKAVVESNTMVLDAYRMARFVGPSVPHIDPLKEVKAEREKLGTTGASIPLTTVEAATEALNGGDSDQNMLQYAEELKESKTLGIVEDKKEAIPTQ
jgi:capsid protein